MGTVFNRVKQKIITLLSVITIGLLVLWILSFLMDIVTPYLPINIQEILSHLSSGDWQTSKTFLVKYFDSFENHRYLVFVILQILQVLIAPIPGQIAGILGGYLFGFWYGLSLTMLGVAIGSFIALGVGRIFGNQLVRVFVSQKVLSRFDYLVEEGGLLNFFMIFLLPFLPDDAVCFVGGLTRLNIWKLLLVCILGRLPGVVTYSFIGVTVETNIHLAKTVFSVAILLSFFIWLFEDGIRKLLFHRTQ